MTYRTTGPIQASDYNQFATVLNSINSDNYSGSTEVSAASFGYGQNQPLPIVTSGVPVTADDWTAMFGIINRCGIHQGVNTSPIPLSVSPGNLITAYNNYLNTQTLSDVIGKLTANRLNIAVGQSSVIAGPVSPSSPIWTTGLSYTFQINFGTWNNARYFFNGGGGIALSGGVSNPTTVQDIFWNGLLNGMGTLSHKWNSTSSSNGGGFTVGFYDLTSTSTKIYERIPSSGGIYYSNNFISVFARTVNTPGTNGLVSITVNLIDNALSVTQKAAGKYFFNFGLILPSGIIPYPGGVIPLNAGSFTTIAATPFTGAPLTISVSPGTATGTVLGAGVATTPLITVLATGGTPPYTYTWQKTPLLPPDADLVFNAPSSASTTVSYNLTSGEIVGITAKVTVVDASLRTTSAYVPLTFNSNIPN